MLRLLSEFRGLYEHPETADILHKLVQAKVQAEIKDLDEGDDEDLADIKGQLTQNGVDK